MYGSHGYLLCRTRFEAIDPARNDASLATEASPCRPGILIASGSYRRLGRLKIRLKLGEQVHIVLGIVEALCRALWQRPAPEVYLLALARLGIASEAALAFEDSAVGFASARAAGLKVVACPSRYMSGDDFAGAWWLTPSLSGAWRQIIASFGAERAGQRRSKTETFMTLPL